MNKLELLRTFVRVSELTSFTQAATRKGLPRSSVSHQVQALKEWLGARLLHRTTCRVQPTQNGLALYERRKDMLANMDKLESLFRLPGAPWPHAEPQGAGPAPTDPLRSGIWHTLGRRRIPDRKQTAAAAAGRACLGGLGNIQEPRLPAPAGAHLDGVARGVVHLRSQYIRNPIDDIYSDI
jgi:hypothetical protein